MTPGDLSGAVLDGRYKVIEPIAQGAMGVVYRAERVKLGRIVAIKVLHDQLPSELASRKRFEIEATAMAKLEHPHCAAVLDVGVHEDKPYVVMDFVSGSNLKDVIAGGPLPVPRAVDIVRQVLSGLAHAHEHGIIHRDIKPANIVLSQKAGLGDHVKILDFGLARLTGADVSNLTTGIVVGTPSYMAPEQIRGHAIDNRTDLYACGVLLFEMLTGGKPFVSAKDDPIEVCSMHLKVPPPRLADRQPGVEFGELEAVVARALAKAPADRYASAEEFGNALEEIVPRKRAMTPIAGVNIAGWSPPADALAVLGATPLQASPPADAAPAAPASGPNAVPPSGPHASAPSAPTAAAPSGPYVSAPSAPAAVPPSGPYASAPSAPTAAAPSGPSASAPSAPTAVPPSGPSASAPTAIPPTGPYASAPTAVPPTGPYASAPSAPTAIPPTGPYASAPNAVPQSAPISVTSSAIIEERASPPAGERPSLPPGFDLSLAIPSPSVAPPPEDPEPPPAPAEPDPKATVSFLGVPLGQPVRAPSPPPATEVDPKATVAFLGAAPSGPSPLAARDVAAVAEASSSAAVERPAPLVSRKQLVYGAAIAAGTIALIAILAIATRGGPDKHAAAPADAAPAVTPSATPADEQFQRATELIADGKHEAALDQLLAARKVFPDDARLAYLAGKVYFHKYWNSAGLKQFRETLRLDPGFRSDPELIRIVLKAFIIARDYPADVAAFLRTDIGAPARPYLQETADTHPSRGVRDRAAAELRRMN